MGKVNDLNWGHQTAEPKPLLPELTTEELDGLLERISNSCGFNTAYATLHRAEEKVSEIVTTSDEVDLRAIGLFYCNIFYDKAYESFSLEDLIIKSEDLTVELSASDCTYIENLSADQSKSVYWFRFRAGRITASNFKKACRTSLEKPSISLIKQICYPEDTVFFSKNTDYGCKHEDEAFQKLNVEMLKLHDNYVQQKCGLIVTPEYSGFGASPDGISFCSCCGMNAIEIKCPSCMKDGKTMSALLELKDKYVRLSDDGNFEVCQKHAYYYQMQMQMALLDCDSCAFVLWSPKDFKVINVQRNQEFWEQESTKANNFFKKVIVPEMMGKHFTNKKKTSM